MAGVQVRAGLGLGSDHVEHDLDVGPGQTFALTGPDATGRTLLRRIAGLDGSKADILFDERNVTDLPPERRNVSMVFPSGALYAHLSVADNIAFGLRARRASAEEIRERVPEAAAAMRIEHLLRKNLTSLGAAERVRVALARALARHPEVLLLDDPFATVSGAERAELRTDLLRIIRRLKLTTLLATPELADAVALAHQVAYVEGGLLRQLGTALDLYEHPADRFVALRIGSPPMQLFTLPVEDGKVRFAGLSLPVPPAETIVVGLRPEALTLEPVSRHARPMFAPVLFAQTEGTRALCELQLTEQRAVMICDVRRRPADGSEVLVFLDLGQLRLFTADAAGVAIPWDFGAALEALAAAPVRPAEPAPAATEPATTEPPVTAAESPPDPPHESTESPAEAAAPEPPAPEPPAAEKPAGGSDAPAAKDAASAAA